MQKMQSLFKFSSFITSSSQYFILLIVFLFFMGTHLLDYYPWVFVVLALFIVNWTQMRKWETMLLVGFILSTFVTWYFLDNSIISNTRLLGQFALIFVMYMIGLSMPINQSNIHGTLEKNLFYFLFIFFIGYMFSLTYSYIFIEQDNPLTDLGMHMCFQNEYKRTQVNGGLLVSTIITYYLTFMAILLPFILLFFKNFQKNRFSYLELIFLSGLSLFSIFLAAEMGRRTTMVLIVVILSYLLLFKIIEHVKKINLKMIFFILILFLVILGLGYYFLEGTEAVNRLISRGFQDRRFGLWIKGIQVMFDYPFGGGYNIVLSNFTKLAHNTWIDVGKDLGVIPFIFFILLSGVFVYHILHMLFNKEISIFIKQTVMIASITLFTILMIEPIFNSDKTFFSYTMFLLGTLITLNNTAKEKQIR